MRKIKFEQGNIYHIFNRGVEKRNIFLSDADRWRFVQGMFLFNNEATSSGLLWNLEREKKALNFRILKEFIDYKGETFKPLVRISADCLMPNHFHLILQELAINGISRFMHKLSLGYAKYFNKKYVRVGSLFQGRFKAVQVGNDLQLQYLLAYINIINPGQLIEPELKEEGIKDGEAVMRFAENFPWSTNMEYLNTRSSIIIDKGILGEFFPDAEHYKEFVKNVVETKKHNEIANLLLE